MESLFSTVSLNDVKIAGFILLFVLALSILSLFNKPQYLGADIRSLIQESAQLCEFSKQDSDPMIALQHASEAFAFLQIARRFATDSAIYQSTGVSPTDLEKLLVQRRNDCVASVKRPASLTSIASGYSKL